VNGVWSDVFFDSGGPSIVYVEFGNLIEVFATDTAATPRRQRRLGLELQTLQLLKEDCSRKSSTPNYPSREGDLESDYVPFGSTFVPSHDLDHRPRRLMAEGRNTIRQNSTRNR